MGFRLGAVELLAGGFVLIGLGVLVAILTASSSSLVPSSLELPGSLELWATGPEAPLPWELVMGQLAPSGAVGPSISRAFGAEELVALKRSDFLELLGSLGLWATGPVAPLLG